jgi:hypothetical protein
MTCLMRQKLVEIKPRLLHPKSEFNETTTIFSNFGKAAFWTFSFFYCATTITFQQHHSPLLKIL